MFWQFCGATLWSGGGGRCWRPACLAFSSSSSLLFNCSNRIILLYSTRLLSFMFYVIIFFVFEVIFSLFLLNKNFSMPPFLLVLSYTLIDLD